MKTSNDTRRFVYIVIDQLNSKLGHDFSASVDHDKQTVTVFKITDGYQAELIAALEQLHYQILFSDAPPVIPVISINDYYEFINSQTGNTIAHATLPGHLTDAEKNVKLEVKRVLLANAHHISLNHIYWQNKNNRFLEA
ncbi:hypothetical protein FO440_15210 [Mucilaginibacter corticis]|uniref:Uncharacterized protein n=1 Tax=Mucilaginibacter corticis TaxID=2597670 RepID=A0A556MMH1_9SPHI|nr:hypothetical protein [Mucilaginibacter corticis]TSJ41075.1 hypothetical protein FO440_15210 [Mucilaginibacter corticis]